MLWRKRRKRFDLPSPDLAAWPGSDRHDIETRAVEVAAASRIFESKIAQARADPAHLGSVIHHLTAFKYGRAHASKAAAV